MSVGLANVELPDGSRSDHQVVRIPSPVVGIVLIDARSRVLLLWRHRWITQNWGYELPAGRAEEGESLEAAAERETLEETGWRPLSLTPLTRYSPTSGLSDHEFHIFVGEDATQIGEPRDLHESSRRDWLSPPDVRDALFDGRVRDGMALTGLSLAVLTGRLG